MTRFARAKGSKASNERREEEATPWHVMRQQLADQLNNYETQSENNQSYNLKEILHNGDNSQKEEVWIDFGETNSNTASKLKSKKEKNHKTGRKKKIEINDNSNQFEMNFLVVNTELSDFRENVTEASVLKKGKFKNKNTLFTNNETSNKDSNKTNDDLTKNIYENNLESSSKNLMKRKFANVDVESKVKLNTKKQKNNITNEKDETQNLPVVITKKNKNNKRKVKNIFVETREEEQNNTIKISCSSEKNESSLNHAKPKVKTLVKTRSFSLTNEGTNNRKGPMAKLKMNVGDFPRLDKIMSIPFNDFCEKKSPKQPGKLELVEQETMIDKSNSNSANYSTGNRYRSNKYSNFPYEKNYQTIIANGREIHIVKYQGFFVKKDDADELKRLRKKLLAQNIPKEKLETIMKLERRKAEKALAREKKKVCYHCRQFGHNFSDCPDIKESDMVKTGVCFKCGSLEHSHFECKVLQHQEFRHAVCFVCKEQGHIARQCPLNSQGLYPKGGSCHLCGEVTHLRKDCPKAVEEKSSKSVTVDTLKDSGVEDISSKPKSLQQTEVETKKKKVIKFK